MKYPQACLFVLICSCGSFVACAKLAREEPQRPRQDLAALLSDADGSVGRARVSNTMGSVDLTEAGAATRISADQPPSPVVILSEADLQREFGDALAALPPVPQTFTLYFQFESDDLTPESKALLGRTLQAVKGRPVPDVLVVGHTDTTGAPGPNFQLALRRANAVRTLLLTAGLPDNAVAVASHGESQPLVPTPDDTYEPQNRRVLITVR
ncbi:MAG: OmpA family protein [Acidobacteria bacterium]|nr:OmpA family protein [Acidobacteriota bacterium]